MTIKISWKYQPLIGRKYHQRPSNIITTSSITKYHNLAGRKWLVCSVFAHFFIFTTLWFLKFTNISNFFVVAKLYIRLKRREASWEVVEKILSRRVLRREADIISLAHDISRLKWWDLRGREAIHDKTPALNRVPIWVHIFDIWQCHLHVPAK